MFGFPIHSRSENFHFSKNFLRSVTVQIKYPKSAIFDYKKKLTEVFFERFPNIQDIQTAGVEIKNVNNKTQFVSKDGGFSGFLFQTKDGKKSINISEEFLIINVAGEEYLNFHTFWMKH